MTLEAQDERDAPQHRTEVVPRLRIAVLSRVFAPTGGGAERYSIALVEQLAQRHEIHVFAQHIGHHVPEVHNHKITMPLRRPRWINQLWYATATWWATRRGFDVVHSHENVWHGNVQTVHVVPVKYNLLRQNQGQSRMRSWLKLLLSPRLLAYLALERSRLSGRDPHRRVVATSDNLREVLSCCYPECVAQLSVITPGVDCAVTTTSDTDRRDARQRLGLPSDGFCVLFVANDFRKKGLSTLLDAMRQLPSNSFLAVVGNPAQIKTFARHADDAGLHDRVIFLGAMTEVAQAYRAADCLAHPTREDTFAMVVLEAMAHGLAVVVSGPRYCGIAGLLQDEVNALILEDPHNAGLLVERLQRLMSEPEQNRQLGAAALAFAHKHQWSAVARQQEQLYAAAALKCVRTDGAH